MWEVVGGEAHGGIVVREGRSLDSQLQSKRLSKGSLIRQLELADGRLHFERLFGSGPSEGWVSIASKEGKELLVRAGRGASGHCKLLACVGDSITRLGYPLLLEQLLALDWRRGRALPTSFLAQFPAAAAGRIANFLRFWHVANFGVGGACACAGDAAYCSTRSFRQALAAQADAFAVCLGANDATRGRWDEPSFVEGLAFILRALKASGTPQAPVLLLTPPPVYQWGPEALLRLPRIVNDQLPRRVLPDLARKLGVKLVDVFGLLGGQGLKRPELMYHDGVHPGPEGHLAIARAVQEALAKP